MSVRVNLLPEAYLRIRQRYRRFKQGLILGAALLVVETAGGILLHVQARRTQEVLTQTEEIRDREERLLQELNAPLRQSEQLNQEILLAERLRSKHYWSRFLATLSETTPERVLLTNVSTNPTKWSKSLHRFTPRGSKGNEKAEQNLEQLPRLLQGMTLHGFAADHHAMAQFVTRVHESKLFRSLDIKEHRRDDLMGKKGVAFELLGLW